MNETLPVPYGSSYLYIILSLLVSYRPLVSTQPPLSGSVSGMAAGMKEAGGELAGGVKGAGSGVAGGVTNAGSAAKRGSVKE